MKLNINSLKIDHVAKVMEVKGIKPLVLTIIEETKKESQNGGSSLFMGL